jgi:hypothetical protein
MDEPLMATTPVAIGQSGNKVHNLHVVLKPREFQVDQHQWDPRVYGDRTIADVRVLPQQMDVPGDGQAVDVSIADDINDYFYKKGMFHGIAGAVTHADGSDASRLDVAVADSESSAAHVWRWLTPGVIVWNVRLRGSALQHLNCRGG